MPRRNLNLRAGAFTWCPAAGASLDGSMLKPTLQIKDSSTHLIESMDKAYTQAVPPLKPRRKC